MKEKISILLGMLYLGIHNCEASASHSAYSGAATRRILPAIQFLSPDKTADLLCRLDQDGIINRNTLVVWDADGTLIKNVSDQMLSGAIPIHPYFSKFIDKTQRNGTVHIVLTNGGARYNNEFDGDFVKSVTPVSFFVFDDDAAEKKDRLIPTHVRELLQPMDIISYESLRVEGLKHIGISLENSFREFEFFQSRQILGTLNDTYSGIPICAPVFWKGIISSNFVNTEIHLVYGFQKGYILRLFLDKYKEQTGRVFSNVVFINDPLLCVENVVEAMAEIDMPCIGINIFPSK
ncbi:MAG: DUF2608 domain-containing protein [Puniceicoccales bacterium]|jgi:hypothetical protein|nr:DUF2608 domain-containing protein [Puniceicoccales bacterium]